MNPALKRLAEQALVRTGVERFARRRRHGQTLVLAYHNILPEGERRSGDSSLHLAQREFANQLDVLARTHQVVPLEALSDTTSYSGPPRVIITFDDGYTGALTAGIEELARRRMPATIFIAPALLGLVPWWDKLAEATTGIIPERVREHAVNNLAGRTEAVLRWAASEIGAARPSAGLPRIGTESQLSQAAASPGITLASHSWSHPNLAALSASELQVELARPLEWLKSRFGRVLPWISYPYGLFNRAVEDAAANAGYLGAFRIEGGWVSKPASFQPFALPRFNVPSGLSVDGLRLRLAGIGLRG